MKRNVVSKGKLLVVLLVLLVLLASVCDARRKNKKGKKGRQSMILRQKETNAINFIRLAAMRLIYGVATRFGFGEQISEALNGAFVPPGVDDYDDDYGFGGGGGGGGFDFLNRDEYDY